MGRVRIGNAQFILNGERVSLRVDRGEFVASMSKQEWERARTGIDALFDTLTPPPEAKPLSVVG